MRRLSHLLSLLLLALWLPATEHCALEAMGLLGTTCSDNCTPGKRCADDHCGTVENGDYRHSVDTLTAPMPDLLACACHLCSRLTDLEASRLAVILPIESFDRPRDWVSTWQFVRRAAPPSRAPTLLRA